MFAIILYARITSPIDIVSVRADVQFGWVGCPEAASTLSRPKTSFDKIVNLDVKRRMPSRLPASH